SCGEFYQHLFSKTTDFVILLSFFSLSYRRCPSVNPGEARGGVMLSRRGKSKVLRVREREFSREGAETQRGEAA
ncbi:MAG: hypothetical protein MUF81_14470, partial [Verrucomicrobia bacterium]|nr:hypothetical protein [Verrucomicrobiota bacterium]